MGIRIKLLYQGSALFLCLYFLLLSQPSYAQFKHKWQAAISVGTVSSPQQEYYTVKGYPTVSIAGNLKPGLQAQAQLMRNITNWLALGGGATLTHITATNIPDLTDKKNFALRSRMLQVSGKIYPLGRNHRIIPFLLMNASYGQVSLEHGKYTYTFDSLSRHSGNPDHPVLLKMVYSKPEASQSSNVLGFGGSAGAEFLLSDAVGLTWQVGYHTYRTEQMQLIGEDVKYWDFKLGLHFRMFKTKRFY